MFNLVKRKQTEEAEMSEKVIAEIKNENPEILESNLLCQEKEVALRKLEEMKIDACAQ